MGAKGSGSLKLADVDDTISRQSEILEWQTELQQACFNEISPTDIQEIVRNQVAKAKEGDQSAIKFVMGHLVGSSRPINVKQTTVITDVETAAKIARDAKGA